MVTRTTKLTISHAYDYSRLMSLSHEGIEPSKTKTGKKRLGKIATGKVLATGLSLGLSAGAVASLPSTAGATINSSPNISGNPSINHETSAYATSLAENLYNLGHRIHASVSGNFATSHGKVAASKSNYYMDFQRGPNIVSITIDGLSKHDGKVSTESVGFVGITVSDNNSPSKATVYDFSMLKNKEGWTANALTENNAGYTPTVIAASTAQNESGAGSEIVPMTKDLLNEVRIANNLMLGSDFSRIPKYLGVGSAAGSPETLV